MSSKAGLFYIKKHIDLFPGNSHCNDGNQRVPGAGSEPKKNKDQQNNKEIGEGKTKEPEEPKSFWSEERLKACGAKRQRNQHIDGYKNVFAKFSKAEGHANRLGREYKYSRAYEGACKSPG